MERGTVERDLRWKQPIPYVVLRDPAGCIAAYPRRGAEERLHGLWSVGVGGHVEKCDDAGGLPATLMACARREMKEEASGCEAALHFRGVVNEELTDVGTVHWGLVFVADLRKRPHPGRELSGMCWLEPARAMERNIERWSRLALGLVVRASD